MKAILEFDLENLDDKMTYYRAVRADDLAFALWDINNIKFRKDADTLESYKAQIKEIFEAYDINVSELVC